MKILWLCNIPLPEASKSMNLPLYNSGGWLTGTCNDLRNEKSVNLNICFPINGIKEIHNKKIDGVNYYAIPQRQSNPTILNNDINKYFLEVIKIVNPDIIHIWGTEYPHTLSMIEVCEDIPTVISIQGLCSIYSKHYMAMLPYNVQRSKTLKEFVKQDSLKNQKSKYEKRGKFEQAALIKSKYVIGRTSWDKACVKHINPNAEYYFCNETLREEFYKHEWNSKKIEKYSIFVSQATYPIKGLHFLLEAMPIILKEYPNTKLYIAGNNITKNDSILEKLKISTYGKYIRKLIKQYNLEKSIIFVGSLNEIDMCNRFLKSNVFVCPSSIENSPNSLGEAMILGVPCVASYTGGIPDMIEHNKEGFLYEMSSSYMLAYYICKIFSDDKLASELSESCRKKALQTHNKNENLKQLLNIYNDIYNK